MKIQPAFVAYVAIAAVAILIGWYMLTPPHALPIYQPSDLNPALVDPSVLGHEDHRILPFELYNQHGDTVGLSDVNGQILVVDFFFTRCATICPMLTANMAQVQTRYLDEDRVRLLSHSVTPKMDSVPVLFDYAQEHGVEARRWWLLTGSKKEVYKLARKSYFAALDEGDGGLQDFVHTENVVLVDEFGRLRGFYDGTDLTEMNRLVADLDFLLALENTD
ncbi:MAG: SCO family protein [Flavobacteriales bacterium]|nr:SCO family protein [Flavobacteriales bacterium]